MYSSPLFETTWSNKRIAFFEFHISNILFCRDTKAWSNNCNLWNYSLIFSFTLVQEGKMKSLVILLIKKWYALFSTIARICLFPLIKQVIITFLIIITVSCKYEKCNFILCVWMLFLIFLNTVENNIYIYISCSSWLVFITMIIFKNMHEYAL